MLSLQLNTYVAGKQMNEFLQENWREVYEDLSPAINTAFTEIVNTIIRGIAGSVPFDIAFPEKLPAN
jgi:Haemolymph juvenile hormone binding protein (JHBP).